MGEYNRRCYRLRGRSFTRTRSFNFEGNKEEMTTTYEAIDFGVSLKALRAKHNITQTALAEVLGVTQPAVALWEKNKGRPNMRYVVMLEKLFGLSAGTLLVVLGYGLANIEPKSAAIGSIS